jgi:hypothetical protein
MLRATGRRARRAHLGHSAQGCGKVSAFSHRGDGIRLLEFAADLHSAHDVCRPQEAVQSERKAWDAPRSGVGVLKPSYLIASSDSPASDETYGVAS